MGRGRRIGKQVPESAWQSKDVERGLGADFPGPAGVRCESGGLAGWVAPQSLSGVGGRACPLCHDSWEFLPDS